MTAEPDHEADRIEVRVDDGTVLHAEVRGTGPPVAVLHGGGGQSR